MKDNRKELRQDLLLQAALRKGERAPDSWKQAVLHAGEKAEQANIRGRIFCRSRRLVMVLVLLLPAGSFGAYKVFTEDPAPMITDARVGGAEVQIKDGFMTGADDEKLEFQFNVSVKKGEVEQIQLTAECGLLLIPKVISEEEFEQLCEIDTLPDGIDGLSRNNGVCRLFSWSEGRRTVSFDPDAQSREMYTHESIALQISKKDIENAVLQMKIIEKDGKITEKEIYTQYDPKEKTALLRFFFKD